MPQLISQGSIINNNWLLISKEDSLPSIEDTQNYLIPLDTWLANQATLLSKPNVGVWLDSDNTPEALQPALDKLKVIAISFPGFADGRGYSIARRLRDQLGYEGELRAIGDVLKDQIFFYQRCGFDSYLVREDRSAENALESLSDFSVVYQSAADQRVPVLRKR